MIFCARATRGLRKPSLDARSGRSISPHPWRETSKLGRGKREEGRGSARCPFCSRNPHDKNVLAWDKSASRHARGWAGENGACNRGSTRLPLKM